MCVEQSYIKLAEFLMLIFVITVIVDVTAMVLASFHLALFVVIFVFTLLMYLYLITETNYQSSTITLQQERSHIMHLKSNNCLTNCECYDKENLKEWNCYTKLTP